MKKESNDTESRMQCVEYARRWLSEKMGCMFSEVDIAADIWSGIDSYTRIVDGEQIPVSSRLNGAPHPPQIGDLIIYGREFLSTGHVAVTTEVDLKRGVIGVGEQNYCNRILPDDHIRCIPLIENDNGFWLLDAYLIGWKQVEQLV